MSELQAAVRQGLLQPGDVTPVALHGALRTRHDCPPVDLLVSAAGCRLPRTAVINPTPCPTCAPP